jgi:hypothetical protein
MITFIQHGSESDLDQPELYEGEAVESDNDFIDDDEPSDSSSTRHELHAAVKAVRNRRSWKASQSNCALCADIRVVLCHLLGLE